MIHYECRKTLNLDSEALAVGGYSPMYQVTATPMHKAVRVTGVQAEQNGVLQKNPMPKVSEGYD